MQRDRFLKQWLGRFLIGLVLVGIAVYTFFHVFAGNSSLMTTAVRTIEDVQLVKGEGYLFRDETVLTSDTPGVVDDLAESGSKVGRGVDLLRVYTGATGEELNETQKLLDRFNRVLRVLEASCPAGGENLSSSAEYRKEADAAFLSICRAIREGNLSHLDGMEDGMLALLNRYRALITSSASLKDAISALKAEKNALLTGTVSTFTNSSRSGYYYDRTAVDGYETVFTAEAAANLTPESFSALKTAQPQVSSTAFPVGKMAYGYKWYLAVSFAADTALFTPDQQYRVAFSENQGRVLTLTCERVTEMGNGEILVLLRSDVTPSDFDYLRRQSVEITVARVTGYYVPETALYTENGVEGVYIFENSTVTFRRIRVLLRGDGYVIAERRNPEEAGYLTLNDILIVSGKKLYDGKVLE